MPSRSVMTSMSPMRLLLARIAHEADAREAGLGRVAHDFGDLAVGDLRVRAQVDLGLRIELRGRGHVRAPGRALERLAVPENAAVGVDRQLHVVRLGDVRVAGDL